MTVVYKSECHNGEVFERQFVMITQIVFILGHEIPGIWSSFHGPDSRDSEFAVHVVANLVSTECEFVGLPILAQAVETISRDCHCGSESRPGIYPGWQSSEVGVDAVLRCVILALWPTHPGLLIGQSNGCSLPSQKDRLETPMGQTWHHCWLHLEGCISTFVRL